LRLVTRSAVLARALQRRWNVMEQQDTQIGLGQGIATIIERV